MFGKLNCADFESLRTEMKMMTNHLKEWNQGAVTKKTKFDFYNM